MKMKLYQNVRGAEARARSFDLSCAELRSHSPKTLFFALKNTDFVVANILREKDAIRKYARRWGQSTISEKMFRNPKNACSENHIFTMKNKDFSIFRNFECMRVCWFMQQLHVLGSKRRYDNNDRIMGVMPAPQ